MKKIRSLFYRILAVVFLLFVAIFLLFYEPDGRTDNTVVIIGKSDKFSEAEIQAAIPFVKEKFKGFTGCNLTKLWYDEEVSNRITNSYMHGGKGMRNGVKAENVLVLMSSFEVGPSGGYGTLNPNSTYSGWNWTLIRDSKTSNWRLDDWGYE